jgi:hypothetical protein
MVVVKLICGVVMLVASLVGIVVSVSLIRNKQIKK